MSYMDMNNLYKDQRILMFKECYALEKIHGTSAHITLKDGKLNFFSGGAKFQNFVALFNIPELTQKFIALGHPEVTVYGEAYGGKEQNMSATYGPNLLFAGFEVKIGDVWLNVEKADKIVTTMLGLEFVPYVRIPATIEEIDKAREAPSVVAVRRGITEPRRREGVVLRPIEEFTVNNGGRVICKHKNEEFRETKTKREVSPEQLVVLSKAKEIADEWVTPMRLIHVLDAFPEASTSDIPKIIEAMYKDVIKESKGEIIESGDLRKAVYTKTAVLFKKKLQDDLYTNNQQKG